jgi:hypothetical protein
MASTLHGDNSANNCILKFDDILKATCSEVGTKASLAKKKHIRKVGRSQGQYLHRRNHQHDPNRTESLLRQKNTHYQH